jgi:mannose/fructose/N-acetylgalactosamine-specific phosphotransferase system component IIC
MTDIGISGNALAAIVILYSLAVACVGAAFAFGIIERRNRKAQRKPKHTRINLTV